MICEGGGIQLNISLSPTHTKIFNYYLVILDTEIQFNISLSPRPSHKHTNILIISSILSNDILFWIEYLLSITVK